jgi:hypothetical protein
MPETGRRASDEPYVLEAGHHPTPFTAAEIRAASPPGTLITQVIDAAGEPPLTLVVQWTGVDEEGGTAVSYSIDAGGARSVPQRSSSSWLELQRHASMPVATTTIDEVVLDSPLGRLDCLRYTRVENEGTISTFWFARAYPGMPVLTERSEKGTVVARSTIVARELAPVPEEGSLPESG